MQYFCFLLILSNPGLNILVSGLRVQDEQNTIFSGLRVQDEQNEIYLEVSTKDVEILLGDTANVTLFLRSDGPIPPALSIEVSFITDNSNIIKPIPTVILTQDENITISIEPILAGHVVIQTNTSSPEIRLILDYYIITLSNYHYSLYICVFMLLPF
ncbi:uncharacterized protein LOC111695873 isoform X2 [Eurytemora carolleeae]|uniref:uncharacterized protein LOC111695873 isoform X2 n=1 Tax=Eurytemora carolleeae TaxID=1294199 RepID=UPI000C7729CA|nr:uncharacterized protein LOC111695873 isoform X2 [Eurytemora carolleeae]|eukprot:XP_023321106.1 uncharacterized protein LOC111695873 isoform X2 [Eurytemora affinis]